MNHVAASTSSTSTTKTSGTSKDQSGLEKCASTCAACAVACEKTVTYCLQKGGAHAEPGHIRLLLDCADICRTSAGFLARGSELHGETCGVCAEVCKRCAESCSKMGDDEQMKACAAICRTCAESCASVAS